jgi:hypothetical protein
VNVPSGLVITFVRVSDCRRNACETSSTLHRESGFTCRVRVGIGIHMAKGVPIEVAVRLYSLRRPRTKRCNWPSEPLSPSILFDQFAIHSTRDDKNQSATAGVMSPIVLFPPFWHLKGKGKLPLDADVQSGHLQYAVATPSPVPGCNQLKALTPLSAFINRPVSQEQLSDKQGTDQSFALFTGRTKREMEMERWERIMPTFEAVVRFRVHRTAGR